MGKSKTLFMDLQVLRQHLEDKEELENYMKRRVQKSKAFSITKALKKYDNEKLR